MRYSWTEHGWLTVESMYEKGCRCLWQVCCAGGASRNMIRKCGGARKGSASCIVASMSSQDDSQCA